MDKPVTNEVAYAHGYFQALAGRRDSQPVITVVGVGMASPRTTILIIDDEPQIRRAVRNALANDDTRFIETGTASAGVDMAAAEQPSLIVLDLGLPDGDGLGVCRNIRAFSNAPIIVLSARHQEAEKVALLDAGADDYITKPFSSAELTARVRAHLRRSLQGPRTNIGNATVTVGDLSVDLAKRAVTRAGHVIHLTPTEWELLRAFVVHADQTLTHQQLFREVWGNNAGDAQQYLRVYVGQLRRKIEPDALRPTFIKTEPAVGYRFETGT